MRFLVDTNLPPALAEWLVELGHEAGHTTALGLGSKSDIEIWRYAANRNAIIVTKDEDFALLKAANAVGPAVVWIRIGNAVRRVLMQRLMRTWPRVIEKLAEGHGIVEVR
jgi:predicted nuclease of predicted toxin-antitoxin system